MAAPLWNIVGDIIRFCHPLELFLERTEEKKSYKLVRFTVIVIIKALRVNCSRNHRQPSALDRKLSTISTVDGNTTH